MQREATTSGSFPTDILNPFDLFCLAFEEATRRIMSRTIKYKPSMDCKPWAFNLPTFESACHNP